MKSDYVIMCGGFGSRLKPFTYMIPKPFLTTNNISPFEYSLSSILQNKKIGKIFVTAFYKKKFIKKIIDHKKKKIKKIELVIEEEPLGTAGCLRLIVKKSKCSHIIVINGDLFAKVNFSKLIAEHEKKKTEMTICIKSHKIKIPYAVMSKKKNLITFKEKPVLNKKINTGIYIIKKKFLINFFKKEKKLFVDMDEVFNSSKKINVFDIGDKWIDIGHINDFKKAYNEIKNW